MSLPDRKLTSGVIYRARTIADYQSAIAGSLADNSGKIRKLESLGLSLDFYGPTKPSEYETMLRDGWPEGVDGVEGLEGLCTDSGDRIHFDRHVGGAFPIVPSHLAGQPDAMLMPVQRPVDSVRGLTLVIDSCFSCMVSEHEVMKYARKVMQLVAWLTAEQIEVAVYAVIQMRMGKNNYLYGTCIRTHGQIVAPERIASILHPCFLRRAWFAMIEREACDGDADAMSACRRSYGTVQSPELSDLEQVLPDAYSVIMLPKVGRVDPMQAVKESLNLKLRKEA